MTHDYKEIWEEFVKRNGEQGFFAEAIRAALQLAQEAEQVRKERDDLANGFKYMDALHKELGIVDLTKETARCREIAKKVTENGNG